MIQVEKLAVGALEANSYILHEHKDALVVDPGAEAARIIQTIEQLKVNPLAVLLTHTHYDHIGAVDALVEQYDCPVYVAPDEVDWLQDPSLNLSAMSGENVRVNSPVKIFSYGHKLTIGPFTFRVTHTPGHSPGGVSLIFDSDRFVITGDALFARSVGRTDLPGSSPKKQIPLIKERLLSLPDDYRVYPGHRSDTTIGDEKEHNPFFQ